MTTIPYVNVPNDLSKIKTKVAFNLTKRQLICFGCGAAVGIPAYLLARTVIGNTGGLFLMLGVMLPAFLLAMYERDGLPLEKVARNIIRAQFLRSGPRPYQTENIYAPFTLGAHAKRRMRLQKQARKEKGPQGLTAGRAGVRPADHPLCGDVPGRGVPAPRRPVHQDRGI